mmetsp:Transcript_38694/g.79251  ORF Transcript_38694/g.79251 Transcript_38694/m.79251 type:complete len:90 (-) Transcript_38694:197-466(-)
MLRGKLTAFMQDTSIKRPPQAMAQAQDRSMAETGGLISESLHSVEMAHGKPAPITTPPVQLKFTNIESPTCSSRGVRIRVIALFVMQLP